MTERDITRGGGEDDENRLVCANCGTCTPELWCHCLDEGYGQPAWGPLCQQAENCKRGGDEGPSSDRSALNPLPEGNRATVVVPREAVERASALLAHEGNGDASMALVACLSAPPSVVGASEPVAWRMLTDMKASGLINPALIARYETEMSAQPLPSPVVSSGLGALQAEERPFVPIRTEGDRWANLERTARAAKPFHTERNGFAPRSAFEAAANPSAVLELITAARASSVGTERSGVDQSPPIVPGVREAIELAAEQFDFLSRMADGQKRVERGSGQKASYATTVAAIRTEAIAGRDAMLSALTAFRGSGHEW